MISKMSLAGTLVLLAASVGQAVAGPTITDKRYWPNEVGPSANKVGPSASEEVGRSSYDFAPEQLTTSGSPPTTWQKTCTYQGGPKGNLLSCR
jgi:hypothetical protein